MEDKPPGSCSLWASRALTLDGCVNHICSFVRLGCPSQGLLVVLPRRARHTAWTSALTHRREHDAGCRHVGFSDVRTLLENSWWCWCLRRSPRFPLNVGPSNTTLAFPLSRPKLSQRIPVRLVPLECNDSFAEFDPEQNFHMAQVFKNRSLITGMKGVAANNAPSLNKTNVGIAVNAGILFHPSPGRTSTDIVLQ